MPLPPIGRCASRQVQATFFLKLFATSVVRVWQKIQCLPVVIYLPPVWQKGPKGPKRPKTQIITNLRLLMSFLNRFSQFV